jgi:fluoroquinolone transport system permease protein
VITAAMLAWLGSADQLPALVPTLMLLVVGGSTFLYIGALIFFEKEQGTLNATIVSPMRPSEYLWSKIATLTGLATLEAVIMIGGGTLIMSFSESLSLPNIPLLLLGIVIMGILYTLAGIILMVRYDKITDFLVPLALIVSFLQLPFLYFWGIFELPFLLVIPTSAPAMLMRGAFVPLAAWEWLYAVGYSAVLLVGLSIWAYRAFHTHIILKVG